jgi:Fic family protein
MRVQMCVSWWTERRSASRRSRRPPARGPTRPDLFVFMYVRKEAVLSSQIEGTQSSLQDLLAAEAHVLDPERPHDVVEVVN